MSAALRSFESQWRARAPDALQPIREAAMQRFLKLGLPSLRDETWRYTDLRSLAASSFGAAGCAATAETRAAPAPAPGAGAGATAGRDAGAQSDHGALTLVDAAQHAATLTMINGCPLLNADLPVINGIEINSIKELYKQDSTHARRFFEARWVAGLWSLAAPAVSANHKQAHLFREVRAGIIAMKWFNKSETPNRK